MERPQPRRLGPSETLPTAVLGGILLAEGYASLAIEILALRRMVPWAGSSVTVTAVLLTVYLAGLASGYARGGRLARSARNLRARLATRLATAAVLAGIWLGETGPTIVFQLPGPTLLHVWIYALAGIGPIAWVLGESVLLAHGCAEVPDASERAGNVFSLSTVGNVAGALATTFVLMAILGTASAVLVVAAALLAASAAANIRSIAPAAAAAALLLPVHSLWVEATIYTRRNAHADYRILDHGQEGRMLLMNGQRASRDDAVGRGWAYVELLEDDLCTGRHRDVLVLGAAGRTLGRGRDCGLAPVFVDIDGQQAEIANEMLAGPPAGPLVTADARAFLRRDRRTWDAIVADAYTHANSVPGHLVTREFFAAARAALEPDGTFYANLITLPGNERFEGRFERTLRSIFAGCRARTVGSAKTTRWTDEDHQPGNRVYRCPRREDDGDTTIYSDAIPRSDLDRRVQ